MTQVAYKTIHWVLFIHLRGLRGFNIVWMYLSSLSQNIYSIDVNDNWIVFIIETEEAAVSSHQLCLLKLFINLRWFSSNSKIIFTIIVELKRVYVSIVLHYISIWNSTLSQLRVLRINISYRCYRNHKPEIFPLC